MSHQDKTPVPPHTRLTEEERAANWKQYQLRVRSFAVPEVDDVQVSTDTAPPPLAYVPPFLAVEGTWELELEEDKKSWENFKKIKANVSENFINKKIKDRKNARKNEDYKLADLIRKELEEKGVIIEDKQEETIWKYK